MSRHDFDRAVVTIIGFVENEHGKPYPVNKNEVTRWQVSMTCSGTWFLQRRRRSWYLMHDLGDWCHCTLADHHPGKHLCKCGGRR